MLANNNKQLGLISLINIPVVEILVDQTDQHPLMDSAMTHSGIIGLKVKIQIDLRLLQLKKTLIMATINPKLLPDTF